MTPSLAMPCATTNSMRTSGGARPRQRGTRRASPAEDICATASASAPRTAAQRPHLCDYFTTHRSHSQPTPSALAAETSTTPRTLAGGGGALLKDLLPRRRMNDTMHESPLVALVAALVDRQIALEARVARMESGGGAAEVAAGAATVVFLIMCFVTGVGLPFIVLR